MSTWGADSHHVGAIDTDTTWDVVGYIQIKNKIVVHIPDLIENM